MPPPAHQRNDSTLLHISINVYNQVLSKKCPKIVSVVHVFLCAALLPFSSASGVSPCLTSCLTMSHHVSCFSVLYIIVSNCTLLIFLYQAVPCSTGPRLEVDVALPFVQSAVPTGPSDPRPVPPGATLKFNRFRPICKTWIDPRRSSKSFYSLSSSGKQ